MKTLVGIGLAILCLCAVAGGTVLYFYQYATTPIGGSETSAVVWIKPGQRFSETAVQLRKAGLVNSPGKFRLIARLTGSDRRIRAGEYRLSASMTPREMLETMVRGKSLMHRVVIPEGLTLCEIGQILEEAQLASQQAFLEAASDPEVLETFDIDGDTLEGYLFPETYDFPKGITSEEIVQAMVDHFFSVFSPTWMQRADEMGLTVHEVVTLAAIVEKETGTPEERPLIAGVFLNRLKRGMRLESDPTVIYGMDDFNGNLTRKDLETPTPYNTYQIKGLPPGPIANPGKASLEAVLYPLDNPYLFFVSKNDGSHHFSQTLAEHNRMVRQYQRRR
jgi:UPF0755 protein